MDAPTATVVAASIAGLVAIVANITVYVNMRRQMLITQAEAMQAREHQRLLAAQNRSLDAIQRVWAEVYKMQTSDKLSSEGESIIVEYLVWIPIAARDACLEVLRTKYDTKTNECRKAIETAQKELFKLAHSSLTKEDENERQREIGRIRSLTSSRHRRQTA